MKFGNILSDVAAPVGNAIEGYGDAQAEGAAAKLQLQQGQEDRRQTLMDRLEKIKTERLHQQKLFQDLNPDLERQRRQKITDAHPEWSQDMKAMFIETGNFPAGFGSPPRPEAKPPAKSDELARWKKDHPEEAKLLTPKMELRFLFPEAFKNEDSGGSDKKIKDIETEISRADAIKFKMTGQHLTSDEVLQKWGIHPDDVKDKKARDQMKVKISPKLRDLDSAELALAGVEKINKENADIIGPIVGRSLEASPYKTERVGKVSTAFKQAVTRAITATGAGSRGYGPNERGWFEHMSEGMKHSPRENQGIIDAWRDFIRREKQAYMDEAERFGITPDFWGAPSSGRSGPEAAPPAKGQSRFFSPEP